MLNPDGTIYTANLRAAKATGTYQLAGGTKRAYEPYFTFHGFRYVEVTGLDYKPEPADVTGIVVYADLARTGEFTCSEPLVNKLTLNSLWGQKGNFLDVPTDCPQRDERAGWTGDAQVFMKTACFNLDAPGFYTKWLMDLCEDSQRADGAFGDVAPHVSIVGFGNTGWSDSGPVCNWRMYEMYGDARVLERHYPALARHMDFLARTSKGLVRGTGAYGDWLRLAGPQHSDAIGTAYYYYVARLMTRIAEAIGKKEDAEKYQKLAEDIRGVFVKTFLKDDGRIVDSRNETGQTFYALAFGLGLVPAETKAKVAAQFVGAITKEKDHLATGFLGTPFVLFALQKAGHPELAYKLVLNKTYPSWLQQVLWGSTTMWERWDGWRPDKGFQDPGMNSFNHYWLGCVSEWLFTQAAGIDTDGPGFQRIVIHPEIVSPENGFSWVKATYRSIRGPITSAWKFAGGKFELNVTVPGNATASVYLPAKDAGDVMESGQRAAQAKCVKFLRQEDGLAVFAIGSGDYLFESRP
jgi:alpha-L-rhamnosidase